MDHIITPHIYIYIYTYLTKAFTCDQTGVTQQAAYTALTVAQQNQKVVFVSRCLVKFNQIMLHENFVKIPKKVEDPLAFISFFVSF